MRAAAGILLAVAACGRLHFEPLDDAHPAPTVYMVSSALGADATVYTLDLASGQLTAIGTINAAVGEINGLADWDDTTLYASSTDAKVLEIQLAPFQVTRALDGVTSMPAFERDGDDLLGLGSSNNELVQLSIAPLAIVTRQPLTGVSVGGGDLVRARDGSWYYVTSTGTLYAIDTAARTATAVRAVTPSSNIVGATLVDDVLYAISRDRDEMYVVDLATGALLDTRILCVDCPTPFDIKFGDMSRSP